MMLKHSIILLLLITPAICLSNTFYLPPSGEQLVGEIKDISIKPGDTLKKIAREHGVGFNALVAANPGISEKTLNNRNKLTIPNQYILPNTPYEGIVINLPEMRLYYYPPPQPGHRAVVSTYAIGIGKEGYAMPPGKSKITSKVINPSWTVPKSVITEFAEQGITHPEVVPPGTSNPLGKYAMRLGRTSYLIHSTNKPYSIGMRVSRGCIRMYPEDIDLLFPMVPSGTPVRIIHQPIKSGWKENTLYVEAHNALQEANKPKDTPDKAIHTFISKPDLDIDDVTRAAIKTAREGNLGIPVRVYTPDPAARR